jgi:putative membrane protein
MDIKIFPLINATLNGFAFLFLFCGWWAIKRNDHFTHRRFMGAALITSTLFLICYLTYHALSPGITRYRGEGILRIIYFAILGTHTPLAAIIVPFCLKAFWHAIRGEFEKHVRITRWLLPVWMYVSVTGVLIYLMLYIFKT